MYSWIKSKSKREILSFLGGALIVALGGLWKGYQYFSEPTVKMEVAYTLCVYHRDDGPWCPQGLVRVAYKDDNTVSDWVAKECNKYSDRAIKRIYDPRLPGACWCDVVTVSCKT
jgi:hypothetical protein